MPELDSQKQREDQPEDVAEGEWQEPHEGRRFGRRAGEFLLDILNPFDAFGEEPAFGLAVLVLIVVGFIVWGLWAVVHEAFYGGGPPQGLGLK